MAYIDRDPDEMIKYASSVKQYAAYMTTLIRGIQGTASFFESELDDNCKGCISKMDIHCNAFLKQVDIYYQLANQIGNKGVRQKDIPTPKF